MLYADRIYLRGLAVNYCFSHKNIGANCLVLLYQKIREVYRVSKYCFLQHIRLSPALSYSFLEQNKVILCNRNEYYVLINKLLYIRHRKFDKLTICSFYRLKNRLFSICI